MNSVALMVLHKIQLWAEAYIKHAEERSNEMATTGILSHDTKLSHPDGEDVRVENIGMDYAIPGTDGGPNFVEVKNGQTIYNYDKIMSYKQYAYKNPFSLVCRL